MDDQVERELLLSAPAEEVWEVVTGSGWLASRVQLDLTPGGEATFQAEEWCKHGWVEEATAPDSEARLPGRLVFWWGAGDEPASRVELILEPRGDHATRLSVVEARPLEVLDVVGIPLPGPVDGTRGPAMLVAA